MESLFSLEVIINFIKLDNLKIKCLIPTIAFRLLDYPTISIPLLENEYELNELRNNFKINKELEPKLNELTHFKDLLDKHGRYIYSKGKSCLFRSELELLINQLEQVPLYLMVLDTFNEPYKLCGTCLIPLNNLINEINNELDGNLNIPCTKITHGLFDIKTLMGNTIGHLSCATRLTNFGVSLLPHIGITHEAIERKKSLKKDNKIMDNAKNSSDTFVQTVPIDYKNVQIQIEPKIIQMNDSTTQVESQIDSKKKQVVIQVKKELVKKQDNKKIEDDILINNNFYCPPVLQYNSNLNNDGHLLSNKKLDQEEKRIEYLKEAIKYQVDQQEGLIFESDNEEEPVKQEVKRDTTPIVPQIPSINFSQFPIIQSLFDEIIKLQQQQQQPSNPNEQLIPQKIEPLNQIDLSNKQSKNTQKPKKLIDYAKKRAKEKALKQELLNSKLQNNKSINNLVGILKQQHKPQQQPQATRLTKEEIFESVNRLSQPKILNKIEKDLNNNEQLKLINQIKNNINNIKIIDDSKSFNSTYTSNTKSSLSLLNRVEMESTIDQYLLNKTINLR